MDERVAEFRVGVLVLASIAIAIILIVLFHDSSSPIAQMFGGRREVTIALESARGVSAGTPIRKRGILIGRVTRVEFDDDNERVLLTADIDSDVELYQDEMCQLRVSLLGDAEL